MKWLDRRSLTLRLTLLFGLSSSVVLILIGLALYMSLEAHFLYEDAIELRGKADMVSNVIAQLRTDADLDAIQAKLHDALVGHANLALELEGNGRVLYRDPKAPFDAAALALHADAGREAEGLTIQSAREGGRRFRVVQLAWSTPLAGMPRIRGIMAMEIALHDMFTRHLRDTIVVAVVAGVLLAAVLGLLAARIGIAPLRAFSALTGTISPTRLENRVEVDTLPPELRDLGRSFNAMLARLQDSFIRLSAFSSDLAHELRTPITALMTQAQVALSRARSPGEYREVMYSALEEYDRLARMITDMLFLAKADHGLLIPARERVDLRAEVLALFDFYDALVEASGIKLALAGSGHIRGDRLMIRRALSNLLSNAIRHATPGSTVNVDIANDEQAGVVTLGIANHGVPISAEHLPRIFDRFYRVDSARERASDGAGLGLSITKSIVMAHGGMVSVISQSEVTRFEMRFPLDRAEGAEGGPNTLANGRG